MDKTIILQSVITCPICGHKQEETMPTVARHDLNQKRATVAFIAVTGQ